MAGAASTAAPVLARGPRLLQALLEDQPHITAVEKFAQWHTEATTPLAEARYRDLIPLADPAPGEQYAFEVDLDRCSGCKSCVAACHAMNGLAEDELWRSVGLLHGGAKELPVVQHVTTACHHCLEPACLEGCPVLAYEKDPATGIVRHLDDQCIGCQYCILKCPYDVPQYNPRLGIVRKCDMCSGRLAAGEAPACVAACPTEAIRIAIVDRQTVRDECEANQFLPGSPEPGYTLPTTIYKTARPLPRNLLPADYYSAAPQHAHLPLVWMLILTQVSVGAYLAEFALNCIAGRGTAALAGGRGAHVVAALALGAMGMAAAVLHLGRPRYAFRALLGLKTSWLSREIAAFSLFAAMASCYAGVVWWAPVAGWSSARIALGGLAAAAGLAGVGSSVMVYVDTRRPFWNGPATSLKFFGTVLVSGLPAALLMSLCGAALSGHVDVRDVMAAHGAAFCRALLVATAARLLTDAMVLIHLRSRQHTPLKRTALLMIGSLKRPAQARFLCGITGGMAIPAILAAIGQDGEASPAAVGTLAALSLALVLAGEWLERYLFFRAVVAPKMPGSPAS
jgi:Fe-S-cluster-containing dehydrogenase component/DMSO reductase anchor subunit